MASMRRPCQTAKLRTAPGGSALALLLVAAAFGATACSSSGSAKAKDAHAEGQVDGTQVSSVAVYPLAGTPDASARSEISFRGVSPGKLHGVRVVGSKSGRHLGRLEPHSDGMGASFVPRKRFLPGERVRVRANLPLVGARHGVVTFRIARPWTSLGARKPFPDGRNPNAPGANHYYSRPDLRPPRISVTKDVGGASPGDLFMAPKSWPGQGGPLIFDPQGHMLWFHPVPRGVKSYDFRTATYHGKPVLTWWQGKRAEAFGGGTGMVANSQYRVIAKVRSGNGNPVDIHEFRVTPQGTALIDSFRAVHADLRSIGGPRDGGVIDGIAMEVDIKTGHVLFEWHSLGHIPLTQSYRRLKYPRPVDYVHMNSVDLDTDGNILVSCRNTSAVYKIDRRTGGVLWRLGGKRSTFPLPRYARFTGQHDFERAADGTYTLFDNANWAEPIKFASRGLVFRIDAKARTARLLKSFSQPQKRGTTTQGSVQVLPDGHYLIGWGGGIPDVSEFAPGGKLVYDAHLKAPVQSYRAYRFRWTGHPTWPPRVAAVNRRGRTVAFVSWNGATEVATWEVLAGGTRKVLAVTARAAKRGFETRIRLPRTVRYAAVRGLDGSGKVLGTSKVVRVR